MGSEFCQAEDVQEFLHCLVRMLIVTEQRGVDSPTNGFHWLLLMYSLVGYTLAGQIKVSGLLAAVTPANSAAGTFQNSGPPQDFGPFGPFDLLV